MKLWPLLDRVYAALAVAAVLLARVAFHQNSVLRDARPDAFAGGAGRMAQLREQA